MRVRLAIGDFSRMTHLSIKALRHYHDVGLLEPAEIDPTSGYRFYEPNQVPIAQVIRRFRDLGLPLDEIVALLASVSALILEQRLGFPADAAPARYFPVADSSAANRMSGADRGNRRTTPTVHR
jgi:DNA-binding transcriptional MerR regulator